MAQFTAGAIARILTEVPAETAIQGIEQAQLERVLTTRAIETLEEVAGYLNLASNLVVFGPQLADTAVNELLRGIERSDSFSTFKRIVTVLVEYMNFWRQVAEDVQRIRTLIDASLSDTNLDDIREAAARSLAIVRLQLEIWGGQSQFGNVARLTTALETLEGLQERIIDDLP